MKENFNLSFKKISKRKVDNNRKSSLKKFLVAALVQSKLDMLHTELIYIDEFSVNERNFNNYGWWEKGKQGYVDYLMDNFSMTFIWAFSEQRFYGIMGNKESNNSASLYVWYYMLNSKLVLLLLDLLHYILSLSTTIVLDKLYHIFRVNLAGPQSSLFVTIKIFWISIDWLRPVSLSILKPQD